VTYLAFRILDVPSQVLCIALLNVAYARSERDTIKAAVLKSRRGSSSSHNTTIISAFDIQATTQVAAILQRLMLLYNIVAPAVVLRFCQVVHYVQFFFFALILLY
jgi:hypothetical protein